MPAHPQNHVSFIVPSSFRLPKENVLLIVAVWVVLRHKQVGQGNRSIVHKAHSSIRKINKQLNTKLTASGKEKPTSH